MFWNRIILDAAPPVGSLGSLAAGDLDGDTRLAVNAGLQYVHLWEWTRNA